MTKEEIRELIADMRAMGLDVELCDTPVPVRGCSCSSTNMLAIFLIVALSPLFLITASSFFDCSERSTTYVIYYRSLIIDMMSSLLSNRVNLALGAWALLMSSSTAFTLRLSAKKVSPDGLIS